MELKKFLLLLIMLIYSMPGIMAARATKEEKKKGDAELKISGPGKSEMVLDANNISSWLSTINSPGGLGWPPKIKNSWNGSFPRGNDQGVGVIYREGLMFGGFVDDGGSQTVRAQGIFYRTSLQPGSIISKGVAENADNARRVWRVRTDYQTADLTADAAEFFQKPVAQVSQSDIDLLRQQYASDWADWPASKGAPWYKVNPDGSTELHYGPGFNPNDPTEFPGIPGATQTVWTVGNDLNSSLGTSVFGAPPIGLEFQITEWSYAQSTPLNNMIFEQFRIIYKGTTTAKPDSRIDSAYVVKFSDPDDGDYSDDLAGSDSTLQLGYVYNGNPTDAIYQTIGIGAAAVGFVFLQGASHFTGNPNDSAVVGLQWRHGYKYWSVNPATGKPLPLSAFNFFAANTNISDPTNAYQWINLMRGGLPVPQYPQFVPFYSYFKNGFPTRYCVPGDPIAGTGWIDGQEIPRGDRRINCITGPFSMVLGDTVEIVVGLIATTGNDNLSSLKTLKNYVSAAQTAYDRLFKLPSVPPPKVSVANLPNEVVLNWGSDMRTIDQIEHNLPGGYTFEGYNVYQLPTPSSSIHDPQTVLVATYDVIDSLKVILAPQVDPVTGVTLMLPAFNGTNSGIRRYIDLKKDYIRKEPLVNGQSYYYTVTAVGYNFDPTNPFPVVLESAPITLVATPQSPNPGVRYGSVTGDTLKVAHAGKSEGAVYPIVVDPTVTTGDQYRVTFDTTAGQTTWKISDLKTGKVVVSGQTNQSGDNAYPIVDGIFVKVIGPPPGANPSDTGWVWIKGTRKLTWAGGANYFGLESFGGAFGYASPYGLFISGNVHSDIVTAGQLVNIDIKFANTDANGNFNTADPNVSYAYRYLRNASKPPAKPEFAPFIKDSSKTYAYQDFTQSVPLAVYDIEDPNNPKRLALGFLENNASGGMVDGRYWPPVYSVADNAGDASGPREWLFIFNKQYATTPDPSLQKNILYNDLPVMYMATWARRSATGFSSGDEMVIYADHVNGVNDIFTFTAPPVQLSQSLAVADVDKINVFPNPYYGMNLMETNRLLKYVTFNHLPPSNVTIRIYNLAGRLVKTIQHSNGTQFETWNLRNEANLPVASGIYIVQVEMPQLGKTKILKLAVIQEEQILPTY
ncbi:MAG: T9SS type A sorting domain-containing protein [Candidatus Kryptoniota bacterium]